MAKNSSRFVLLCQQTLAVGVVVAITAPAANLVTLDIVVPPQRQSQPPTQASGATASGALSVVASRPVRPQVSTVPLRGVSQAGLRALHGPGAAPAVRLSAAGTSPGTHADRLTVLSAPQPVDGLATVGVTWAHGVHVPDQAITVAVRTERRGSWSAWTKVPYHQDEGPDPRSAEGRAAEPGTDPIYVGAVDDVQVKALTASGTAPAGMRLALVDPGRQVAARAEKPAIDTGRLSLSDATSTEASRAAARVTAKPRIFSRAQWGAEERMRERSALHYGEVHGGFVHHTVNANGYSAGQVPAIIRGIYAFHTQSRGWSDIGYNFLVDRFGRIWEGRYGGVTRPVVGAHTLGYNDDAFAMSAIGNYDIARPSSAMVDAFGRLFAWKLSLHGVFASSRRQWITKRYLPAINGHRDVGQTACPGRYLYAQIPTIRARAARYQRSFAPRVRTTRVAGNSRPVIVARDRRTKQLWLVSTRSNGTAGRIRNTGTSVPHANLVLNAGDWDGDGRGDVITRSSTNGRLSLYRGTARGHLRAPVLMSRTSFGRDRLLAAVGDMTGDGRPDLMGQPVGGGMRIFPGNGVTGFRVGYVAHSAISAISQLGVGFWNRDGSPDSVLRRSDGTLVLYPGNGPGGLTGGTRIGSAGRNYDWVVAVGDITGDHRPDLVARAAVTHRMWLLPGSPDGFVSRRSFRTGMGRFDLGGEAPACGRAGSAGFRPADGPGRRGSGLRTGRVGGVSGRGAPR
jgi:hypothetical protein